MPQAFAVLVQRELLCGHVLWQVLAAQPVADGLERQAGHKVLKKQRVHVIDLDPEDVLGREARQPFQGKRSRVGGLGPP